jgi:hypothetical protein
VLRRDLTALDRGQPSAGPKWASRRLRLLPGLCRGTISLRPGTGSDPGIRERPRAAALKFWDTHPGPLPIVTGSVVRVELERLPRGGVPDRAMWLWHAGPVPLDLVTVFAAYQRRFDIEHFSRFGTQWLGWTRPAPRLPGWSGTAGGDHTTAPGQASHA